RRVDLRPNRARRPTPPFEPTRLRNAHLRNRTRPEPVRRTIVHAGIAMAGGVIGGGQNRAGWIQRAIARSGQKAQIERGLYAPARNRRSVPLSVEHFAVMKPDRNEQREERDGRDERSRSSAFESVKRAIECDAGEQREKKSQRENETRRCL